MNKPATADCTAPSFSALPKQLCNSGNCKWVHPEDKTVPVPISLLHLRKDVVSRAWGSSAFKMILGHKVFRMRCRQRFGNASSFMQMALVGFDDSHPIRQRGEEVSHE